MTDMRSEWLPQGTDADHTDLTLSIRVALCPPPPVARVLSYPSWKVIVSASRGQYLKPGSHEPGFFSWGPCFRARTGSAFWDGRGAARGIDRISAGHHHSLMITIPCILLSSKKALLPGASDRRAR